MGIIQQIIDFIMGLFGRKQNQLPAPASPAAPEASAAPQAAPAAPPPPEEEDDDEDDAAPVVLETRDGARLVHYPDDDETMWESTVNRDIPREQWTDVWGPAGDGPTDETLISFLHAQRVFEEEAQSDPRSAEAKIQAMGYRDAGEYFKVYATVGKHFGEPTGPNLDEVMFAGERFTRAMLKADGLKRQAEMQVHKAAHPELFEPIAGVSLELYAELSALAGTAPDQLQAKLAEHGLDMTAYSDAAAGWAERMQNDTNHVLNTAYAEAFQSAGQGQFGGASQAVAGGMYGQEVQGEAPMPQEKAAEIRGAIQAWSKTGQDVNAMLQQTFGMTAAEEATVNGWWSMKLMADAPAFEAHQRMVDQYEAQYAAGAPAAPDSDLSF